jgi:tetratricopeptide (TPR) repeat protein
VGVRLGISSLGWLGLAATSALPGVVHAQARAPEQVVAEAEAQLARGELAEAEAAFRSVLGRADALGVRGRVGLARTLLETGRYDDAIQAAEEAVRRSRAAGPERVPAVTVLGEALLRRGRLDDAQRVLEGVRAEPSAHRARVMLGRTLLRRGRAADARPVLMELVRAYNDDAIGPRDAENLAYVGMAAAMLGSAHDANDAFGQSSRADRRRPETQIEWAELFLSHYDAGHAEECLRDALAVTPRSARAQVLAARVALAQGFDFDRARRALDEAAAIDPAMPAIHTLRASIALRSLSIPEADAHLDRALATDPTDLEALSMRAAVRFLADDTRGFEQAVRATLAVDPTHSELYTVVAEHADWEHRYPDIVRLADEALRIDPRDARAMATRGTNLLRLGREAEGLEQLRQAFRRDRFNVRTFNTLNLYDDVISTQYEWVEARGLSFRFHSDERPVLDQVVVPVLTTAFADMRRRYGHSPRGTVFLEMFASSQHFSVRTEGLPNLGVQGVCFGQVVTALSPRAAEIDWAQVTTHEMAHVFHIQLSQNRVPRWFTEGLAEHETVMARPEWRRENDPELRRALGRGAGERGGLPPLSRMNEAFTHAHSGAEVMTAYYASSRVVAYLEGRFGFAALPRMLRAWGEGRTTEDVVQRVLGVPIGELDRDWRAAELARLAPYASHFDVELGAFAELDAIRAEATARPADAAAQARLGAALLAAGQLQPADAALRAALQLDAHEPTARFLLARIALERHDAVATLSHVDDLVANAHDGPAVRILEAQAALAAGQRPRARTALEQATALDPSSGLAWRGLASIAEEDQDAALREAALRRIVVLEQHDRASLGALVALLAARSAWPEVLALGDRVRFLDPHGVEPVLSMAEAAVAAGDREAALRWTEHGLAAARASTALGRARVLRVRALVLARRARDARAVADEARAADATLGPELDRALSGSR